MSVDFSLLKRIDFTNTDNIIFLSVIFVLGLIVFFVFLFILVKIVGVIKKLIRRIFSTDSRKPKFNQKTADSLIEKAKAEKEAARPKPKILGSDSAKIISSDKEELEEKNKNIIDSQKEKGQKDIAEGLSKLKAGAAPGKETLESKMPSRFEDQEENSHEKIKIPRAKRFTENEDVGADPDKNLQQTKSDLQGVSGFEKTAVTTSHGIIKPTGSNISSDKAGIASVEAGKINNGIGSEKSLPEHDDKGESFFSKPGFLKNAAKKTAVAKSSDTSIFGGKEELTRMQLRHKLRYDPKVWEAGVETRLNLKIDLSRAGRERLEKELFPNTYGRNISKADIKRRVRMMVIEQGGADPARRETLRREVKFLKKIGGIK